MREFEKRWDDEGRIYTVDRSSRRDVASVGVGVGPSLETMIKKERERRFIQGV